MERSAYFQTHDLNFFYYSVTYKRTIGTYAWEIWSLSWDFEKKFSVDKTTHKITEENVIWLKKSLKSCYSILPIVLWLSILWKIIKTALKKEKKKKTIKKNENKL